MGEHPTKVGHITPQATRPPMPPRSAWPTRPSPPSTDRKTARRAKASPAWCSGTAGTMSTWTRKTPGRLRHGAARTGLAESGRTTAPGHSVGGHCPYRSACLANPGHTAHTPRPRLQGGSASSPIQPGLHKPTQADPAGMASVIPRALTGQRIRTMASTAWITVLYRKGYPLFIPSSTVKAGLTP